MATQATAKSEEKSPKAERGLVPFIEDCDRMVEDVFAGVSPWRALPRLRERLRTGMWGPAVDILQKNGDLIVRADVPGVKREDIEVALDNNVLKISGQRKEEQEVKEKDYYRSERSYGEFSRAMRMPEGVKAEDIAANFKDGVLEVVVSKGAKPEAKRTSIPVQ
jgi:HSP20 family protein